MNRVNLIICSMTFTLLFHFSSFADTTNVSVFNNQFNPSDFTVSVGDYIKWTLMEGVHTTTSDSIPSGALPWDYSFSGIGDSFIYQVTICGDYHYKCLFHSGMNGMFFAIDTFSVTLKNGWNMVSIPGLHPIDQNANTWFAFRDPGANVFKYAGGYQSVTTLTPGLGYWLKHAGFRIYNCGDEWPACGIIFVPNNPVPASSGWNLFGVYENSVQSSLITTTPPGLLTSPIYKYDMGYQIANVLFPGLGYWVKLLGAGFINLPDGLLKSGGDIPNLFPDDWGKILISDALGRSYTLYAVNSDVKLDNYELPPQPPSGMFDIRYGSGRIAEDLNNAIKSIEMSGITYPLTVRVEGMDIRLMDESGKMLNTNLKSGENVVIDNATINKLMVSGELLPTVYSLEQNYPNPFNPSTVIEFSLPEDVANVKLSIYNVLGEKVIELVNTSLKAGKYQYQWNAQNVATGMYIYEFRTDNFISVKKMLFVK